MRPKLPERETFEVTYTVSAAGEHINVKLEGASSIVIMPMRPRAARGLKVALEKALAHQARLSRGLTD
jgi:hypothetical protein